LAGGRCIQKVSVCAHGGIGACHLARGRQGNRIGCELCEKKAAARRRSRTKVGVWADAAAVARHAHSPLSKSSGTQRQIPAACRRAHDTDQVVQTARMDRTDRPPPDPRRAPHHTTRGRSATLALRREPAVRCDAGCGPEHKKMKQRLNVAATQALQDSTLK